MPIKILLVEDTNAKWQQITKALVSVPDVHIEDVRHVTNIRDAKQELRTKRYDVLVLDILVPQQLDGDIDPEGGITLLKEISVRNTYFFPEHIVAITAAPEALSIAEREFSRHNLSIIQYHHASDSWILSLTTQLTDILRASSARKEETPSFDYDLGIVTALPDPELTALLRLPWNWREERVANDTSAYWCGTFGTGTEQKRVAAVSANQMGMAAAAVITGKLISTFRPRLVGMVGICAGLRDKTQMGDVLIANPTWDWGSGKWIIENGMPRFVQTPHQLHISSTVRSALDRVSNDTTGLHAIRRNWPGAPNHDIAVKIGPVACGAAVLADGATLDRIRSEMHGKVIGVEMESYGVYLACEEASHPRPEYFSMKSVVDYADSRKGDDYQLYGAYTSANVLALFVHTFFGHD